jgi:hypothetical protein
MSFSYGSSESSTQTKQEDNPWEPSIPYLKNYLGKVGAQGKNTNPTAMQSTAITNLQNNAGNPWAAQIGGVADDAFAFESQSPTATAAYQTLQDQIGGYARGENLNFDNNPYIKEMLKVVGDDTQNRVNQMWAGVGRDMSAGNQQAVSRGVQQAQLPILSDLYSQEQGRTLDAAKTLYGAGTGTAQTVQGLDKDALGTRAGGVGLADAAITARDLKDNTQLKLEADRLGIPLDNLERIKSLLLPAAGLGGTRSGTSDSEASQWGVEANAGNIIKAIFGMA